MSNPEALIASAVIWLLVLGALILASRGYESLLPPRSR